MKSKQQVAAIIAALKELYPDALCSLDYQKDYELLFSVRLAAQCTDARVNLVTPALFARYPTLEAFAAADVDEVGTYIHSCGFWRAKARDIVAAAQMLVERFGGKVPDNMDDLLSLPGVGRKPDPGRYLRHRRLCVRHPLHPHHRPSGSYRRQQGSPEGGAAAAPCHSPGGGQQLLPPHGAPRPRPLHGAQAQLRRLSPAPPLRLRQHRAGITTSRCSLS